jgi:urease subunit gamma
MHDAASALTKEHVMEGVADMITLLQVEAVFTDGSRLVSIHHPIK